MNPPPSAAAGLMTLFALVDILSLGVAVELAEGRGHRAQGNISHLFPGSLPTRTLAVRNRN